MTNFYLNAYISLKALSQRNMHSDLKFHIENKRSLQFHSPHWPRI